MNLQFSSKSVSYEEALDGDIVQVMFDEDPDDDPLNPQSKHLCASINYEISPLELLFEWTNGVQCGGGLKAQKYTLDENQFSVILDDGMSIEIGHSADTETTRKISALLLREVGCQENA